MSDAPPMPVLCENCAAIVRDSDLQFVLCGGICVGLNKSPLVWRLRHKDEGSMVKRRTEELRKLAAAMRLLVECSSHLPLDLKSRVAKFCNMQKQ